MSLKTPLIVDIETDGQPAQSGKLLLAGWQFADEPTAHLEHGPEYSEVIRRALADAEQPIVSMTKFDPRFLRLQGWEVNGPYYDLQVMAWVLNENQMLSLDKLAKRYCGIEMDKRLNRSQGDVFFRCDCGKKFDLREMSPDMPGAECHWARFETYCVEDVEAETQLFNTLWARLDTTAWLDYFLDEEVPFTAALLDMECNGLPVNLVDSEALRARLEVEAETARDSLLASASLPPGFNVNSGAHMAKYLFEQTFRLADKLPHEPGKYNGLSAEDKVSAAQATAPDGFFVDKVGRCWTMGEWVLRGRNLPATERTPKGDRWSTASPILRSNAAAMRDDWVSEFLAYRKVEKVLTTYLRKFPLLAQNVVEAGVPGGETVGIGPQRWRASLVGSTPTASASLPRLYGRFNQTGTKTGRLSSSEPNLQNIPAHGPLGEAVRGLFQGRLVVGDYSQLEPRLMAHFSGDPVLSNIYRKGLDTYLTTAQGIFGGEYDHDSPERGIAKTLVLAMGYGAGPAKVAQILTINGFPTADDVARGYLRELQSLYATFFNWREAVISRVKQKGYVTTIGGRHRRLKAAFEDRRNFKNVGYGERQAVNAVVQGSAGDIVRKVMVDGNWQHEQRLLAQVHDELVWEWDAHYDPSEEQLAYIGEVGATAHGFALNVPLVFEPHFGPSWFAAKEGIELPDDMNEETQGFEEE